MSINTDVTGKPTNLVFSSAQRRGSFGGKRKEVSDDTRSGGRFSSYFEHSTISREAVLPKSRQVKIVPVNGKTPGYLKPTASSKGKDLVKRYYSHTPKVVDASVTAVPIETNIRPANLKGHPVVLSSVFSMVDPIAIEESPSFHGIQVVEEPVLLPEELLSEEVVSTDSSPSSLSPSSQEKCEPCDSLSAVSEESEQEMELVDVSPVLNQFSFYQNGVSNKSLRYVPSFDQSVRARNLVKRYFDHIQRRNAQLPVGD